LLKLDELFFGAPVPVPVPKPPDGMPPEEPPRDADEPCLAVAAFFVFFELLVLVVSLLFVPFETGFAGLVGATSYAIRTSRTIGV
jgi:hypothetical protein